MFYSTKDNDGQESEIHEIETTLNHRFWSEGEWKSAGTLKVGDLLTLADGTQVEITDVTFEDRHETVYNMEVADYHTYYVGEDGVWVHNRYGQQGGTAGAEGDSRFKWGNPKSKPTYGHTFTEHGQKQTSAQLSDRARRLEHQVGQWTNDQKAADFLSDIATNGKGVYEVDLPSSVGGRSFLPNGMEISADKAIVVVNSNGSIKTAYPFNSLYPRN